MHSHYRKNYENENGSSYKRILEKYMEMLMENNPKEEGNIGEWKY